MENKSASMVLKARIRELEKEKDKVEDRLGDRLTRVESFLINPAPYIKKTVSTLANDEDVQKDVVKTVVHHSADFLIDQFFTVKKTDFVAGILKRFAKPSKEGSETKVSKFISSLIDRFAKR